VKFLFINSEKWNEGCYSIKVGARLHMKAFYIRQIFLISSIVSLLLFTSACSQNLPFVGGADGSEASDPSTPPTEPTTPGSEDPPPVTPPEDEDEENDPEEPPVVDIPESILLQAEKSYRPSRWEDGIYEPEVTLLVRVPEFIEVTHGNAGNHRLRIYFDSVKCFYKGGSSVSRPLQNPSNTHQISLGKKYHYEKCMDAEDNPVALLPLEFAEISTLLRMRIDNGDSTETTVVIHDFEVAVE